MPEKFKQLFIEKNKSWLKRNVGNVLQAFRELHILGKTEYIPIEGDTSALVTCPVCNTKNEPNSTIICRECNEDLTSLGRLIDLPLLYYNKGIQLARVGLLEEAMEKLIIAAEMRKNDVEPLVVIGKICAQKEQYMQAIYWLGKALKIDPDNNKAQQGIQKARDLLESGRTPIDKVLEIQERQERALQRILRWLKIASLLTVSILILVVIISLRSIF